MNVVLKSTDELTAAERNGIFRVNDDAHMADHGHHYTQDDQDHAEGGMHFLIAEAGTIVSHASVVPRLLIAGDISLRTGYVEAVATSPSRWKRGFATAVMREANEHIRTTHEMGALSTGANEFYERLGWVTWRGPTSVRTESGLKRTVNEDGCIMALITPATPAQVHIDLPLSCEWRAGDVW